MASLSSTAAGSLSSDFWLRAGDLLMLLDLDFDEEPLRGFREPLRDLRELNEAEEDDDDELQLRDHEFSEPEFRELDREPGRLLRFEVDDADDVLRRRRRRSFGGAAAFLKRRLR